MIETFSASLFLGTVLGGLLAFVGCAVVFVAALAGWMWALHRTTLWDGGGVGAKILRPASFVLVVLGSGALYLKWLSSMTHEEIDSVRLMHVGDQRILQVSLTWQNKGRGAGGTHSAVEGFTMDGELMGRRSTSASVWRPRMTRVGTVKGADVLHGEDELVIVDPVTHQTLVDVTDVLDDAFGAEHYRISDVVLPAVMIEHEDGRVEPFDLASLVPTAVETGEIIPIVGDSACWAEGANDERGFYGKPHEDGGLLRARLLQQPRHSRSAEPCVLDLGQPVWLALHRSTAFGADGTHLLSALPVASPDAPLWTTDLEPALGWMGTERYEIYSPHVRGDVLCMWLVRELRSVSEVCVSTSKGELRSAVVVF